MQLSAIAQVGTSCGTCPGKQRTIPYRQHTFY